MLEFVGELFVNAAPNTTAWCETLEVFLEARKYKLTTRVQCYNFLCMVATNPCFRTPFVVAFPMP
jgi:hypothetical protein